VAADWELVALRPGAAAAAVNTNRGAGETEGPIAGGGRAEERAKAGGRIRRLVALGLGCSMLQALGGAQAEAQWLRVGDWGGRIVGRADYSDETVSPASGEDVTLRRLLARERLGIHNRGSLYSPDLLAFRLAGEFGLFQEENSGSAGGPSGDGTLVGYDARATLLRERRISLDAFAFRNDSTISRDFAGTSDVRIESKGATVNMRSRSLPATVYAREEELDEEFRAAGSRSERDERRRIAGLTARRSKERSDADLRYEFTDFDNLLNPFSSFTAHDASLVHRLLFGEFANNSLNSSARLFDRSGSISSRSITASEALRLTHHRDLATVYRYSFANLESEFSETRTHSGSVGINHQYYQSLNSSLLLSGTRSDFTQGDFTSYGPNANLSYRKRIPWNGFFLAGVAGSYRVDDQTVPTGRIDVFAESHTFGPAGTFLLDNRRVDPATVVITDVTGTTIFEEGPDYTLTVVGDRLEVERNPLGLIEEGQTVLVDYTFEVPPELRFSTTAVSSNVGLDFGLIHIFYINERSYERLMSGDDQGLLEDIKSDTAGVELRWERGAAIASAFNQYRNYRSERLTFESVDFDQVVVYRFTPRLRAGLSASQSLVSFENPTRETEFYTFRANMTWRPLALFQLETFAGARLRRDSLSGDTDFFDFGGRIRGELRALEWTLSYDHFNRSVLATDSREDRLALEVIRRF